MRTIHRCLVPAFAIAVVIATSVGCDRRAPVAPTTARGSAFARLAGNGATFDLPDPAVQHVEGATGPGSTYFFDVPPNWNHDLVVYVHGIVLPPSNPVGLPNYVPLRDALLAQGFAVAASSFDVNGYAVKDGTLRTHQLSGLFISKFGPPHRTFLLGRSLGGIISEKLAETYPGEYAGCLSVSGVLCGSRAEIDYIGTLRVLFDALFPGVLPGTLFDAPPMTAQEYQTQVAPKIAQALMTNPAKLGYLVGLMGGRLQGNTPTEFVFGIIAALGFQILDANDIFALTHDHPGFDNAHVIYASPGVPQSVLDQLNADVARYTATPDAVAYLLNYYEPTGNLLIPMFTLHNARDPQVPSWHEDCYKALVEGKGHGDNLFTCKDEPFGHDQFSPQQIVSALGELVTWVETGVKPTTCP